MTDDQPTECHNCYNESNLDAQGYCNLPDCERLSEWSAMVTTLEAENAEQAKEIERLTNERGHANIRLVATILYLYVHWKREGWEDGPGPLECWQRVCDEVFNLIGPEDGVDGVARWLADNDEMVRRSHVFDLSAWYAATNEPPALGQDVEMKEGT